MKFSGLFRGGALALITVSQLAWPNLAHSQKESSSSSPKALLKSEKEVSSKKATTSKPITQDAAAKQALPNKNAPTETKAAVDSPHQENVVKQSLLNQSSPTEKKATAKPNAQDTVVKQTAPSKNASAAKKGATESAVVKGNAGKEESGKKIISTEPTSEQPKKKQVHSDKTSQNEGGGLIPPPPAYQPSYLIGPGNSLGAFQPEFMTKEMAQQRLKDLEKQVIDSKSELEDKTAKVQEMKERSERFASLYTEGVVSRHEFEAAGKEADEAQKQLEQYKSNLAELEREQKALNEKVKPAAKKNLQASKSSNNHKRRANGSRS